MATATQVATPQHRHRKLRRAVRRIARAPGHAPGRSHHRRSRPRRPQLRRRQRRPQVRSLHPDRRIQERPGRTRSQAGRLRLRRHRRARKRLRRHASCRATRPSASPRGTRSKKRWSQGEIVTGTVNGKVKGGLTVLVNGIRAFLPGSLVDIRPVKDTTPVRRQDPGVQGHQARPQAQQRRAVAPRRASKRRMGEERAKLLETLKEGADRQRRRQEHHRLRRVRRPRRHRRPAAHHRPGMAPRAAPVGSAVGRPGSHRQGPQVRPEKNRVSLGLKQLGDDPWIGISRRYPQGTRLFGKVTNITDYGAFVEIEPGIEGLVHVSEMDWTNKNVASDQGRVSSATKSKSWSSRSTKTAAASRSA